MRNNFSAFTQRRFKKISKISRLATLLFLVFTVTGHLSPQATASNIAREAMLAYQIGKTIRQGEVIELSAGTQPFLAIYQETSLPVKQGGLIILHDLDQNPDAPGIIRTLRTRLAESGWDTLSIQIPVPVLDRSPDGHADTVREAPARIEAAARFFTGKNRLNLAIIGHGLGASMASAYLEKAPGESPVQAAAMISLDASHEAVIRNLQKIKLPVLDVYGSRDLKSVVATAKERKRAIMQTAGNPNFRQIMLEGADYLYTGMEESLFAIIRGWLASQASGWQLPAGSAASEPGP